MPKPPSWLDQINTVIRFIDNPCDAPWAVYFETSLEPAGRALLTLLTFGLDDVVRGFARPKGLRSGRHGRRGRRSSGRLPRGVGIPEIGEMIGENLPGAEEAKGRRVSQGVKNLWLVDGAIQRVLFWWMVIDVVSDFAYDWVTAIGKTEFCRKANLGAVLRTRQGGLWAALFDWGAAQAPDVEFSRGPISTNNSNYSIFEGNWTIAFAVKMTNTDNLDSDLQIRIRDTGIGGEVLAISEKAPMKPGDSAECVVSLDAKAGDSGILEMRIEDGFQTIDDVMHYYQEAG